MSTDEHAEFQEITIKTVDQAVKDWFDLTVAPHVKSPTEGLKKVPVLFASGERWHTNRNKVGIRDKNGLLILPLISIKRTNLDRDRSQIALGTEEKTLTIAKQLAKKTNTIQNAISARNPARRNPSKKVVYEITTIPFPDWYITGYEIEIQTQYTSQMNNILEKIFNSLALQNSFVMPVRDSEFESDGPDVDFADRKILANHYFVGFMDTDLSDTGNFEEFTDNERIIKYSFNITVPTYLQLDPEGTRPALQTKQSTYKFDFNDECVIFVEDYEALEDIFPIGKYVK